MILTFALAVGLSRPYIFATAWLCFAPQVISTQLKLSNTTFFSFLTHKYAFGVRGCIVAVGICSSLSSLHLSLFTKIAIVSRYLGSWWTFWNKNKISSYHQLHKPTYPGRDADSCSWIEVPFSVQFCLRSLVQLWPRQCRSLGCSSGVRGIWKG